MQRLQIHKQYICFPLLTALLPQLTQRVFSAFHQTHHPLTLAQIFLNIFPGYLLTEASPIHYHSHLRFGKTCQQTAAVSQALLHFPCFVFFLPITGRCPVPPARPLIQTSSRLRQSSLPPLGCKSVSCIQALSKHLSSLSHHGNERELPHFCSDSLSDKKGICYHYPNFSMESFSRRWCSPSPFQCTQLVFTIHKQEGSWD